MVSIELRTESGERLKNKQTKNEKPSLIYTSLWFRKGDNVINAILTAHKKNIKKKKILRDLELRGDGDNSDKESQRKL